MSEWISVDHQSKPEGQCRVHVYSPVYAKDHPMRHRIMDSQFLSLCSEATHWKYLDEPKPQFDDQDIASYAAESYETKS